MDTESGIVAIVHTSFHSVDSLTSLFADLAPEVTLRHLVDDSLLAEVMAEGGLTEGVQKRLGQLIESAETAGCDLILSQCSSVGEAADAIASRIETPVVKLDTCMARRACELGGRIAVVATLATTLGPTRRLIEATAAELARVVEIESVCVDGAFDAFSSGDRKTHDARVLETIRRLCVRTEAPIDCVVCAQGSMATIVNELGETRVPVLTSPLLGVRDAIRELRERAR